MLSRISFCQICLSRLLFLGNLQSEYFKFACVKVNLFNTLILGLFDKWNFPQRLKVIKDFTMVNAFNSIIPSKIY